MVADLEQRAKNPQKANLTSTSEGTHDTGPVTPLGTVNASAYPGSFAETAASATNFTFCVMTQACCC